MTERGRARKNGNGERRERKRGREGERKLPFCDVLCKCPQEQRLDQGEARNCEPHSGLPRVWQEPRYLTTICCLLGVLAGSGSRSSEYPDFIWNTDI